MQKKIVDIDLGGKKPKTLSRGTENGLNNFGHRPTVFSHLCHFQPEREKKPNIGQIKIHYR